MPLVFSLVGVLRLTDLLSHAVLYAAMEQVCRGLRRAVNMRANRDSRQAESEPMGYFGGVLCVPKKSSSNQDLGPLNCLIFMVSLGQYSGNCLCRNIADYSRDGRRMGG